MFRCGSHMENRKTCSLSLLQHLPNWDLYATKMLAQKFNNGAHSVFLIWTFITRWCWTGADWSSSIYMTHAFNFFLVFGLSLCMVVTAYGSSFVEVKQTVTDDTIQGDFDAEGNCNVRCIIITQSGWIACKDKTFALKIRSISLWHINVASYANVLSA